VVTQPHRDPAKSHVDDYHKFAQNLQFVNFVHAFNPTSGGLIIWKPGMAEGSHQFWLTALSVIRGMKLLGENLLPIRGIAYHEGPDAYRFFA
jgi:hypothetical protein